MGMKLNFTLSIIALVIAVVACALAVWMFLFQPAPLTKKEAAALVEEKTKAYVTEERVKKIAQEAVAGLKSAGAE